MQKVVDCNHHRMTKNCPICDQPDAVRVDDMDWECDRMQARAARAVDNAQVNIDWNRYDAETKQDKAISTVPERLHSLGSIYEERSKVYGSNYFEFGKVMMGCFPNGVTLATEEEFCRFCIFVQMASKMTRYGQMFKKGGHPDSLDDNAVYSQMLSEVDETFSQRR